MSYYLDHVRPNRLDLYDSYIEPIDITLWDGEPAIIDCDICNKSYHRLEGHYGRELTKDIHIFICPSERCKLFFIMQHL